MSPAGLKPGGKAHHSDLQRQQPIIRTSSLSAGNQTDAMEKKTLSISCCSQLCTVGFIANASQRCTFYARSDRKKVQYSYKIMKAVQRSPLNAWKLSNITKNKWKKQVSWVKKGLFYFILVCFLFFSPSFSVRTLQVMRGFHSGGPAVFKRSKWLQMGKRQSATTCCTSRRPTLSSSGRDSMMSSAKLWVSLLPTVNILFRLWRIFFLMPFLMLC